VNGMEEIVLIKPLMFKITISNGEERFGFFFVVSHFSGFTTLKLIRLIVQEVVLLHGLETSIVIELVRLDEPVLFLYPVFDVF
jgi:hypothetical protein